MIVLLISILNCSKDKENTIFAKENISFITDLFKVSPKST